MDVDAPPEWETVLWSMLDNMDPLERIKQSGALITYLASEMLPALASYRRNAILEQLREPGWDATRLAESIGSRRNAINRLAGEGRRLLRDSPPPV